MERTEKSKTRRPTLTFYLDLSSSSNYILVSNFGIDLKDMMCGLLTLEGKIELKDKEELTNQQKTLYLCSDICENSIVSGALYLPILRKIKLDEEGNVNMDVNKVLWINTTVSVLRSIQLFLRNGLGEEASLSSCNLNCTLLVFPKTY